MLRHGSLFSGIGGFDLAAEWMGWENVFHCEIAPYQRAILQKRFPDARSIKDVRDIYRFTNEYRDVYDDGEIMWCDRHNMDFADCECIGCSEWDDEFGAIDILTGGFPCVDITHAKNAKEKPGGINGKDSKLWFEFKRVCGLLRPRFAVVENAANLNRRGLDVVVGGFADIGFDCVWFNVPASRIGSPHQRQRTFIVAHTDGAGSQGKVIKEMANAIARRFDANTCRSTWWDTEPGLDRMVDGISARMDNKKQRIESIGNAVIPQVAYQIFKAIEDFEKIIA